MAHPTHHPDDADDADTRIRRSAQALREWQWIAPLSSDPPNLLVQLRREARALIALGLEHPGRAGEIGKIVVAYHRLMVSVKKSIERSGHMRPMPGDAGSSASDIR